MRPLPTESIAATDLLFLAVSGPSCLNLLVNIYNAPAGSTNEGEAVRALINLANLGHQNRIILVGDFNLRHKTLLEWIDQKSLALISEPDTPTHDCGNVLVLVFASNTLLSQGAKSAIAPRLDITLDHLPITTTIPWDDRFQEPLARIKLDTLNEPLFSLLETKISSVSPLENPQPDSLDKFAKEICTTIHGVYLRSARRALGKGTGQPWWNEDFQQAVRAYRQSRRSSDDPTTVKTAKRLLIASVRRTKRNFFRDQLN
ncbi:hypothetical protein K3495_g4665 [Podosphaera aphanis]|nr:hypothetical protein K3495_g4665 [Podosphaera aphanis]